MAKLAECKTCGKVIAADAKACPHCGAKQKKSHIILRVFLILLGLSLIGSIFGGKKDNADKPIDQSGNPSQTQGTQDNTGPIVEEDFDDTGFVKMSADVLFSYGKYMEGEKVITVITIADISSNTLKAHTENGSDIVYSISCKFENRDIISGLEDGDTVTVCGTVAPGSALLDTVSLENCKLIGLGEIESELRTSIDEQTAFAEQLKQEYEQAALNAVMEEKELYASECVAVNYTDVARNPDSYDGVKIKITGEVIQVSEGWFNSVAMRIDCNGNVWYVTYMRSDGESRILEGDTITAYGECDGVTTYTSVLGSQITIPSLDMKYYD